ELWDLKHKKKKKVELSPNSKFAGVRAVARARRGDPDIDDSFIGESESIPFTSYQQLSPSTITPHSHPTSPVQLHTLLSCDLSSSSSPVTNKTISSRHVTSITKQKPATVGSRLQSTVGSLNPKKIMEQSTASLAKITGKQQSTSSTTYEVTGAVGSYRNSQDFYSDRAMLAPASLSPESQEDLTEALETSLINPEDNEREDQEDDEFVVVDAADEWHWVDHWVKYLVD
ncbi:hypothetical protein V8F06_003630, partial [Rhypophila decipiens]